MRRCEAFKKSNRGDRSARRFLENGPSGSSPRSLNYNGVVMDCVYRADLVVEDSVLVEVKSVQKIERVHEAQMLSYLRLSNYKVGLLIDFNVKWLIEEGVRRFVNGFPE